MSWLCGVYIYKVIKSNSMSQYLGQTLLQSADVKKKMLHLNTWYIENLFAIICVI